jgi:hypothetical protein
VKPSTGQKSTSGRLEIPAAGSGSLRSPSYDMVANMRVILRPMMDIGGHVAQLRNAGADGLDQYETRLRNNADNPDALANLFCEGLAALMFLHDDWQVTLRERPDLQLGLHGDVVYAEVKRFCEKKQDRLNEQAILNAPDDFLVRLDDPTQTEGKSAWEQIVDVAIKKASVYVEGASNILVVVSDSECLDLMVSSAVHEYDERALESGDSRLRRLNGIMLVNRGRTSGRPIPSNVEFCQTQHEAVPLNERLATALGSILRG